MKAFLAILALVVVAGVSQACPPPVQFQAQVYGQNQAVQSFAVQQFAVQQLAYAPVGLGVRGIGLRRGIGQRRLGVLGLRRGIGLRRGR